MNQILKLDEQRRTTIQKLQEAQARRNAASSGIGQAKAAKDEARAKALMEEVAQLKIKIREGEAEERRLDEEFRDTLAGLPNFPADDVPVGPDASANLVLRKVGMRLQPSFPAKQHFELGEALGLMDFETAAKLSGSQFVVLTGALARLERALSQFMLDLHTSEHGYTEVSPPLMVLEQTMYGTGQLPKFDYDQFLASRVIDLETTSEEQTRLQKEILDRTSRQLEIEARLKSDSDEQGFLKRELIALRFQEARIRANLRALQEAGSYWLIPTAEVPLTNLVREDITDEAKLPIRVTAGTPLLPRRSGRGG